MDPLGNVPVPATTFVGREMELDALAEFLAARPLVSVVGAGGTGKTRLATEVVGRVAERFSDGMWFVALDELRDASLVPFAVATAIGATPSVVTSSTTDLVGHLRTRRTLVILDCCERVLDAARALAEQLVESCPFVTVLATSRSALGSAAEAVLLLEPLDVATDDGAPTESAAVRLFLDRARSARPDAAVGEALATVARICRRLDGLPLAIELAAARVGVLSLDQIDQRLADRFHLAAGGHGTRHESLRALVDWSYDLLDEPERRLFHRAAIFDGGFTLDAAEAVCVGEGLEAMQMLDLTASLARKSMLVVEERNGVARYRYLDTLLDYARELLAASGEEALGRARHRAWVCAATVPADQTLHAGDGALFSRLQAEEANFRAAFEVALDEEPGAALVIAGNLWRYWQFRGGGEGRRWIESALAAAGPAADRGARANALTGLASLAASTNEVDLARSIYEGALAIRVELGDTHRQAIINGDLGMVALREADYDEAERRFLLSITLHDEGGDEWGAALARANLGQTLVIDGRVADAEPHLVSALDVFRRRESLTGIAMSLNALGGIAIEAGDVVLARARFEECVAALAAAGDHGNVIAGVESLARAHSAAGDPARATALLAAAERARGVSGFPRPPVDKEAWDHELVSLRTALGGAFDLAWSQGQSVPPSSLADFALARESNVRDPSVPVAGRFRREGEFWSIHFGDEVCRLRDAKGLQYLARLLGEPGREFHCGVLASAEVDAASRGRKQVDGLTDGVSDLGPVLDAEAIAAYRRRLVDLTDDLTEAEHWNDPERAERAQQEIDALSDQLRAAYGLGGRQRVMADASERPRKAVSNRIHASLTKIAQHAPVLGRHLAACVQTGTYCRYVPNSAVRWET